MNILEKAKSHISKRRGRIENKFSVQDIKKRFSRDSLQDKIREVS